MATKSGMNYDKVQQLISYLNTQRNDIINNLTELSNEAPAKIAMHYSGQAAESYKTALSKVITDISETLDTMISELRVNTEQKQADYTAQDAKMQETINVQ